MFNGIDALFPLVILEVAGDLTPSDVAAMSAFSRTLSARNRQRLVLADCRRARVPSAEVRHLLGEMVDDRQEADAREVLASAVLLSSGALVAAMQAIYWCRAPVRPLKTFLSAEPALAWLRSIGEPAGIVIPDAPLQLQAG